MISVPARPEPLQKPGRCNPDTNDNRCNDCSLQNINLYFDGFWWQKSVRTIDAPDSPERSSADLLANGTTFGRNMNNSKVNHIQGSVWSKLAMRWSFKSIMGKFGCGTRHFVDCKVKHLSCLHVHSHDFEASRNGGPGDRRNGCEITETGYKSIAIKTKPWISCKIKSIRCHVGLKRSEWLRRVGIGKLGEHWFAPMTT